MFKKRIILAALLSAVSIMPAFSQGESVSSAQNTKPVPEVTAEYRNTIDKNHWVYKTLENFNKKYNTNLEKSNPKLNMEEPLTRNEAAYLLISLVGKINKNNVQLSEYDKGRLDSIEEELQSEIQELKIAVDSLQSSVTQLKAIVSKLEKDNDSTIKTSIGKNFKLTGSFQSRYTGNMSKGSDSAADNFRIPVAELGFKGKLQDHVDVVANFQPGRYYDNPSAKTMMGDLYVSTDIIPKNTLYLGQTRIPIGYEGTLSSLVVDTVEKSQISRLLSDKRDIGVKIAGNYKYMDYYAGAYNGSRYASTDNNNNMDVSAWVNFKPLVDHKKYGDLLVGGGYTTGSGSSTYDIIGGYVGYKYKKWGLKYEYAMTDGGRTTTAYAYDSKGGKVGGNVYNLAGVKADGWYATATYDLTKKIQLLAKMDQFDPNTKLGKDKNLEYTLGTNYFMKGNNLKFQLNYVIVDNQGYSKNSQRILAQTQYAF